MANRKYRVGIEAQFDTEAENPEEIRSKLRRLLRDSAWHNVNLETSIRLLDGRDNAPKFQILTSKKPTTPTSDGENHTEIPENPDQSETRTKSEITKQKSPQTHQKAQKRGVTNQTKRQGKSQR